eukprot:scaffold4868_cov416-Prasinococcus_capsulatus_cf.AAC.21
MAAESAIAPLLTSVYEPPHGSSAISVPRARPPPRRGVKAGASTHRRAGVRSRGRPCLSLSRGPAEDTYCIHVHITRAHIARVGPRSAGVYT